VLVVELFVDGTVEVFDVDGVVPTVVVPELPVEPLLPVLF
jgi:hypothetical protein